jgi:hypothetical protein
MLVARARSRGERGAGTTVALAVGVDLRPPTPTLIGPRITPSPRPRAEGSGAFASPLPSMLELSAATRAVAAEPALAPAVAALQREVCRLTGARDATVVTFDWASHATWTLDGSVMSSEVRALIARVAGSGQRDLWGHALIEPIGTAPAPAVVVVRGARFTQHDLALIAALTGGVAATLQRLIAAWLAAGSPAR